jgi:clan AA aspartic protease
VKTIIKNITDQYTIKRYPKKDPKKIVILKNYDIIASTEVSAMGKTLEKVTVKNFGDIVLLSKGMIGEDEIREVEVEALVDTGAAFFCLPPGEIEKLGLLYSHTREVTTANGKVGRRIFGGAVIIIQGRDIEMQVMENDAVTPPLIGYLILEAMDFVVDPKSQKILPNPAHDGKWIIDLY